MRSTQSATSGETLVEAVAPGAAEGPDSAGEPRVQPAAAAAASSTQAALPVQVRCAEGAMQAR
ncbi:hypothetical protein [Streptomyces sp. NPDC050504]|uniref:hypothetical protein n=1 Tax=Streptomyces sp. NPDC050504 TaxID=3365618 RepID=UPI003793AF26